jgi:hypothetical protein
VRSTFLMLAALAVGAGTVFPGAAVPAASVRDVPVSPSAPAVADGQPPVKDAGQSLYGPFFLYNDETKLCADLPGNGAAADGAPVAQSTCARTGEDNQEFVFENHGPDNDGYQQYHIKNVDSGYCLDVPGRGAVPSGTLVQEAICLDQDNEDFRVTPRFTADGLQYYWLQNTVAGLMCLDVVGTADTTPGVRLSLVPCLEHDDHEWALVTQAQLPRTGAAEVNKLPAAWADLKILLWGVAGFAMIVVLGLVALFVVRRRQKLGEANRAREAAAYRDSFWQPPINGRAPGNDEPTRF